LANRAALNHDFRTLRALVEAGGDPTFRTVDGLNALEDFLYSKQLDMKLVAFLVGHGCRMGRTCRNDYPHHSDELWAEIESVCASNFRS
jgi:ankyrin repeat protein